jgi:cellulose synthase/poly-beta-1,6-N-acetylglucosamine synthase-like glycosyltransferase
MELLFWFAFGGVTYAYFGYPLALLAWSAVQPSPPRREVGHLPTVSILLPVHNEEAQLSERLENLLSLDYPRDAVEILVLSDGSTDGTNAIVREHAARDPRLHLIELEERRGKGNAINTGVRRASHDIVVFTDAGILLEPGSLRALVAPFADPAVGCVSGEDHIQEPGGEGLYGRYELFLRRRESRIHSLVGASGSFYGQRRELCPWFAEGLAPDLLSVLHVVDQGYRAVSEPAARGTMKALTTHGGEFRRKVRTLIRGMTALFRFRHLLNPLRYGAFAFFLFSHKLVRWAVPVFLVAMLGANVALAQHTLYAALLVPHALFYVTGAAVLAGAPRLEGLLPARIAGYFVNVNAAIAVAWWRFLRGQRTELWTPTRR